MTSTTPLGRRRAFVNNKGGVGKTMFVAELAAALARRGRTVLAVDMDPQANLSRRLRATPLPESPTPVHLAEVLRHPGEGDAADAQHGCGWPIDYAQQISVLPGSFALEDRVLEAGVPGAATRLARALYEFTDGYDYTLFDCPPSMGHLTQLVLAALNEDDDAVILPVAPEHDAIAGASRTIRLITEWTEHLIGRGRWLTVAGALVNHVRGQTTLHQVRLEDLPGELQTALDAAGLSAKVDVWEPYIPLNARIAELQDAARPASSDRDLVQGGIMSRFDDLADVIDRDVTR